MILIIFGNRTSFITYFLLKGTLETNKKNKTFNEIYYVETNKRLNRVYTILKRIAKRFFFISQFEKDALYFSFNKLYKEYKFKIIYPNREDINNSKFVQKIKGLNAKYGLVIGCPQILIDSGEIILQDTLIINKNANPLELDLLKVKNASNRFGELFKKLISNNFNGIPQQNVKHSYFGKKQIDSIRTIINPSILSYDELSKRVEIFYYIKIKIKNRIKYCNKIILCENDTEKYDFVTLDDKKIIIRKLNPIKKIIYKLKDNLKLKNI